MEKDKTSGADEKPRPVNEPSETAARAHKAAEKDIERDKSMDIPSGKEDFLDEGELARKEGHP